MENEFGAFSVDELQKLKNTGMEAFDRAARYTAERERNTGCGKILEALVRLDEHCKEYKIKLG